MACEDRVESGKRDGKTPDLPWVDGDPLPPGERRFPWYALRVKPRFERKVSQSLHQKGYEEFAPFYRSRRRWSDRTKTVEFPLFPGYIFCRFDPTKRLPILETPGVTAIVSFGKQLIPVDEAEIRAIQATVRSGAEVVPWPYLRLGQRVRIVGGPLGGLTGLLLDLQDGRRLVLSVTMLQRSVAVEISREEIEPIL